MSGAHGLGALTRTDFAVERELLPRDRALVYHSLLSL